MKKYNITKNALTQIDSGYIFFMPDNSGLAVYLLDKNYDLTKKIILKNIKGTKIIKNKNKFYLLGYDEIKNRPVIIELSENLTILSKKYIGNKYDVPRDLTVKKGLVALLTTYKNKAQIELVGKENLITNSNNNLLGKFIIPFNNGYLVIGSIQHPYEDLLILFIKNNKIIWKKIIDFGMEDSPLKVVVNDDKVKIEVISQDYMGAEKYINILINKNGEIIKKEKNIELKTLPQELRT
jgi:hypothetical protein